MLFAALLDVLKIATVYFRTFRNNKNWYSSTSLRVWHKRRNNNANFEAHLVQRTRSNHAPL